MLNRFHKLFKRSGALVAVLFVLICCALPASAADTGSSDNFTLQSVLPFDSLTVRARSGSFMAVLPWIGDRFFEGSTIAASAATTGDYEYTMSGSITNSIAGMSFTPTWALNTHNMYLYLENLVIRKSVLQESVWVLTIGQGATATVSVSGYVSYIVEDNGTYVSRARPFSGANSGTAFDICGMIYRAIMSDDSDLTTAFTIQDLQVSITDVSTAGTFNVSTSLGYEQLDFGQWLNSYHLSATIFQAADPGDLDFTWLVTSVSGMLGVELWPEFSIGGLLRVIFVVGFLFWFLKLTF